MTSLNSTKRHAEDRIQWIDDTRMSGALTPKKTINAIADDVFNDADAKDNTGKGDACSELEGSRETARQSWMSNVVVQREGACVSSAAVNRTDTEESPRKSCMDKLPDMQSKLSTSAQAPLLDENTMGILGAHRDTTPRGTDVPEPMNRGIDHRVDVLSSKLISSFQEIKAIEEEKKHLPARFAILKADTSAAIVNCYRAPIYYAMAHGRIERNATTDGEIPSEVDRLESERKTVLERNDQSLDQSRDESLRSLDVDEKRWLKVSREFADASGFDMVITPELAVKTSDVYDTLSMQPHVALTDGERSSPSGLRAQGVSEREKRQPDLELDSRNLAHWALGIERQSKNNPA